MTKATRVISPLETPAKEPPVRFGKPVYRCPTKTRRSFYIGM
jgi:hypothetical protein